VRPCSDDECWGVLRVQTRSSCGVHGGCGDAWHAAGQEKTCARIWRRNGGNDGHGEREPLNVSVLFRHASMQIARATLSNGGSVKGWIPRFLTSKECSGDMVGDTEVTETMSERKAKMFEASDA
jgi:hypothetical protein